MLARVFKIDVMIFSGCGGTLRPICSVTDIAQVKRYLMHIGEDPEPPPRKAARFEQESFDFGQTQSYEDSDPVISLD